MALSKIDTAAIAADAVTADILPAGSVLQVKQEDNGTGTVSTTSTSYQDSGLEVTITPSSTSSKILVMVAGGEFYQSSSGYFICALYKDGSSLVAPWYTPVETTASIGGNHSAQYLDSPATTSAVTYTVYFKGNNSNTSYFQDAGSAFGSPTITAMEIAG